MGWETDRKVLDTYRANLANVVAYVLKGAEPDVAQVLGLSKLEASGRVIGKRCGWSENLGVATRRLGSVRERDS